MGDNIYISFWNSKIPEIIEHFESSEAQFSIDVSGLSEFGDRASYYARFKIIKGQLDFPNNAYAQGRDFHQVLINTDYFKKHLNNKEISVRITRDLKLEIDMEATTTPEFFKKEDLDFFTQLHKTDATYRKDNPTSIAKGERVKQQIFAKTNYWARIVTEQLPDFDYEEDNSWNISGNIKKYSWARLFLKGQREKKYYVTLGVSSKENAIVYKFDCQREGQNKLNDEAIKKFDAFAQVGNRDWEAISSNELSNLNWDILRERTVDFVKRHQNDFKILHDLQTSSNRHALKPDNLNIILYGPPGTGKTYNSIDLAVKIATNNSSDHKSNKAVFDNLRGAGQIEFITFHQNYTYEDFMVGIKPDIENSNLRFVQYKGIFYQLCKKARDNYESSRLTNKLQSFDDLVEEMLGKIGDDQPLEFKTLRGKPFWLTDYSDKTMYLRKSTGSEIHTLSISTLIEVAEGRREMVSGLGAYYYPIIEYLKKNRKTAGTSEPLKNYVLVIDEINRANISKVFGELITLLEYDKRLGQDNELRISLPNGEKDFGIPSNLYVIGTMNTADKSIALIDIALRRRFEFKGYYPIYEGYDQEAARLLEKINEKIYSLKNSSDYLVGHAYFMNGNGIEPTLRNKVIPLLMEYFSGKINLVSDIFKDTDWSVSYNTKTYSWDIHPKE